MRKQIFQIRQWSSFCFYISIVFIIYLLLGAFAIRFRDQVISHPSFYSEQFLNIFRRKEWVWCCWLYQPAPYFQSLIGSSICLLSSSLVEYVVSKLDCSKSRSFQERTRISEGDHDALYSGLCISTSNSEYFIKTIKFSVVHFFVMPRHRRLFLILSIVWFILNFALLVVINWSAIDHSTAFLCSVSLQSSGAFKVQGCWRVKKLRPDPTRPVMQLENSNPTRPEP